MDTLTDIRPADLADPQVQALIVRHTAYGDAHYPADSNHHLSVDEYASSDVMLWTAWQGDVCLGMVGLRPLGNQQIELKSMHVIDAARGRGIGAALVTKAIAEARAKGCSTILLETGSKDGSAAARALYERFGFSYCAPFADYALDPQSVFMSAVI